MPKARRDFRKLDGRRQSLVLRWREAALKVARSWSSARSSLREEFEAEAMLTLCELASLWDESRDVPFEPYMVERLGQAKARVLRALRPRGYRSDGRIAPPTTALPTSGVASLAPDFADAADAAEFCDARATLLRPREQEWLKLHRACLNDAEVAARWGTDKSYAGQVRRAALARMGA